MPRYLILIYKRRSLFFQVNYFSLLFFIWKVWRLSKKCYSYNSFVVQVYCVEREFPKVWQTVPPLFRGTLSVLFLDGLVWIVGVGFGWMFSRSLWCSPVLCICFSLPWFKKSSTPRLLFSFVVVLEFRNFRRKFAKFWDFWWNLN